MWIDARIYGLKGDGVTAPVEELAALERALAACPDYGTLYIAPGMVIDLDIDKPAILSITRPVRIMAHGALIRFGLLSRGNICVYIPGSDVSIHGLGVRGCCDEWANQKTWRSMLIAGHQFLIEDAVITDSAVGLELSYHGPGDPNRGSVIRRCQVSSTIAQGYEGPVNYSCGICLRGVVGAIVEQCDVTGHGQGVLVGRKGLDISERIALRQCDSRQAADNGFYISSGEGLAIERCHAEGFSATGFKTCGSYHIIDSCSAHQPDDAPRATGAIVSGSGDPDDKGNNGRGARVLGLRTSGNLGRGVYAAERDEGYISDVIVDSSQLLTTSKATGTVGIAHTSSTKIVRRDTMIDGFEHEVSGE